jgi:hypothetical protein
VESLCGDSFGCCCVGESQIGTVLDWNGEFDCGSCKGIAVDILSFIIGEPIEFVLALNEWVPSSKVMERLSELILFQALQPQFAQLAEMRS